MALRLSALALILMAALACVSAATTTPSSDASTPAASPNPSEDIGNSDSLSDDLAMSPDDVVEGGLGSPLPAGVLPPPDMSQSSPTDTKSGATHNASSAVKLQTAAVAGFACISLSLLL